MADFEGTLANLLKARFPYIYVSTWEEQRALSAIYAIASDAARIRTPRRVFTWRLTEGMKAHDGKLTEDLRAPVRALDYVARCEEPAVFVFLDFHIYLGTDHRSRDNQVIRKMRDLIGELKHSAAPKNVVLISPLAVLPQELEKDVTILDMDLPSQHDIESLIDAMIVANRAGGRIAVTLDPEDRKNLAKAALGLTCEEAENAFARAMVLDGRFDERDLDVIMEEKRQIIRKSGILEFIDSGIGLADVGGLDNLKVWLAKRDKSWLEAAKRYCLPEPKGILIMGIPGCGKSLVAKAISGMWHLPLLRLDVGKIFGSFVGSSEENIRKATKVADAAAPCVLWIDEIEKGFSGVGSIGDSGTTSRVFGTFLTWLQEKTNPVFVVATSNEIEALRPELLRKGRFDEVFFVDLPASEERADIFRIHLEKRLKDPGVVGDFRLTDDVLARLSGEAEGFSGAEIEQAVISGLFEAFSENRSIRYEDFEKAVRSTVPLSVTQAEKIQGIRDWAGVRAVPATSDGGEPALRVTEQEPPADAAEPSGEVNTPAESETEEGLLGGMRRWLMGRLTGSGGPGGGR
ncbi:MAG: AAA family ATPase [Actinomycetota bacterium]